MIPLRYLAACQALKRPPCARGAHYYRNQYAAMTVQEVGEAVDHSTILSRAWVSVNSLESRRILALPSTPLYVVASKLNTCRKPHCDAG